MGKVLMSGGGGSGIGSDDLTATLGDVIKGKSVIAKDTDDEIGTGTLELTGDATVNDVLAGKGFYNTDPKSKQTGGIPIKYNWTYDPSQTDPSGSPQISRDDSNSRMYVRFPGNTYYKYGTDSAGNLRNPYVYIPYAPLASVLGVEAAKMLDTETIVGVKGTIPSYHTNQSSKCGQNSYGVYFLFTPGYYYYENESPWVYRPLSDFGAATTAQVLTGTTFTSTAGLKVSGTMPNQGAKTVSYTPSTAVQTYTIPAGCHNGSGKVTINAIPSKYVDFSAGITFFEYGAAESAMFTALGTCNQKPQAGIPVSEWKTTWAYKYDEVSWNNYGGPNFILDYDENDQVDTQHGFCTKKSMDFTGIKTMNVDFSSNTGGSVYRFFFYNISTYKIIYKDVTYDMTSGSKGASVDISSVTGQCLWGMYAVDGGAGYTGGTLKYIKFSA